MASVKTTTKKKAIAPKKRDQQFGIQQIRFIEAYFDPKSPSFGDAKNSGIAAGFSETYAEVLGTNRPKWLSVFISRHTKLIDRATDRLEEVLNADVNEQAMGAFGPIIDKKSKKPVMRRNPKVMAIVLDASKFTLERLDSKSYGKTDHLETEHTGEVKVYHIPARQTPEDWAAKALPPGTPTS